MRKVPVKNYIVLFLLFVITTIAVLSIANWYKASKEFYSDVSIMINFLGEVKESEIETYILENPDVVIYVSSDIEENTQKFEKKLKDYITKEDIKSHFIYLNFANTSEKFISEFQKKYFKGSLKNIYLSYPNLLIFDEGKVVDVLYKLKDEPDIKDVKKFLEKNGVVEDA